MRLTHSAGYALVAVGHIARHADAGSILAKVIAERYDIPIDYLLKILQQLVRGGILHSTRGPRGGFVLARPAGKITLLQVVEASDGPFVTIPRVCDAQANLPFNRRLAAVYEQALRQAAQVLAKTTLASLGLTRDKPNAGAKHGRKKASRRPTP